jgi:hypothetical protein
MIVCLVWFSLMTREGEIGMKSSVPGDSRGRGTFFTPCTYRCKCGLTHRVPRGSNHRDVCLMTGTLNETRIHLARPHKTRVHFPLAKLPPSIHRNAFEQLENRESRGTANHLTRPMHKISNIVDVGSGAGLNMRPAMRCAGCKPYQEQDRDIIIPIKSILTFRPPCGTRPSPSI